MFASPSRPAKWFLGSGSPGHPLWPQPYIAICGLGPAEPLGAGHQSLWCGHQTARQTPKVMVSIGPFPWTVCCDSLAVGSRHSSGSTAATGGRTGGRLQPQPRGTPPWWLPSIETGPCRGRRLPERWPPEKGRCGPAIASRSQVKIRGPGSVPYTLPYRGPWELILTSPYPWLHPSRQF